MSRATRPNRRVSDGERHELARALDVDVRRVSPWRLKRIAYGLACRPAHLRRCLLGREVSARAARRILFVTRRRPR